MRLSEAIRLGATMKPQGFGSCFPVGGGSCALGAALDAIGKPDGFPFDIWPEMIRVNLRVDCPECGISDYRLSLVAHLNDEHRWTRERIADFVELHEPLPNPSDAVVEETSVVEPSVTAPAAQS